MSDRRRRTLLLTALLWLSLTPFTAANAELTGVVFVDQSGDGIRSGDESGLANVRVSNGRESTLTDANGRYTLAEGEGFVWITRPSGYRARPWYARASADFGLEPRKEPERLFFIQFSDAHVFDRLSDFENYSSPEMPWYIPEFAADYAMAWMLGRTYDKMHPNGFEEQLRQGLRPFWAGRSEELDGASAATMLGLLQEEMKRPGSGLGDVAGEARRSIEEIAALGPDFVISTGDMVLEGNQATPEAVTRWFAFYGDLLTAFDVPVYNTIGNNEISGISRHDWPTEHPRYGRGDYHESLGPSHYSFDHGPFHFVALDTHRPAPLDDNAKRWRFDRMQPEVEAWAAQDLAAHEDRVIVVLNHEPFHWDDAWPFERHSEPGADAGLFDAHGVDYVLSGHTHWNSHLAEGGRHHLTTGALSGMRWVLPATVHPRGYRLFLGHDRRLHSAWKATGEPVIAVAEPPLEETGTMLFAAADTAGPFVQVEARIGDQTVPIEPLGRYFFMVPVGGDGPPTIYATRADGSVLEQPLAAP